MVIDTHIRPALFGPICRDRDRFRKRCDEMNYHLMGPSDMDLLKKQYALADSIRQELTALGISLEDNPTGTTWRHVS